MNFPHSADTKVPALNMTHEMSECCDAMLHELPRPQFLSSHPHDTSLCDTKYVPSRAKSTLRVPPPAQWHTPASKLLPHLRPIQHRSAAYRFKHCGFLASSQQELLRDLVESVPDPQRTGRYKSSPLIKLGVTDHHSERVATATQLIQSRCHQLRANPTPLKARQDRHRPRPIPAISRSPHRTTTGANKMCPTTCSVSIATNETHSGQFSRSRSIKSASPLCANSDAANASTVSWRIASNCLGVSSAMDGTTGLALLPLAVAHRSVSPREAHVLNARQANVIRPSARPGCLPGPSVTATSIPVSLQPVGDERSG